MPHGNIGFSWRGAFTNREIHALHAEAFETRLSDESDWDGSLNVIATEDLGSSNGIKVNGVRCESKFLFPGDEVWIAKHKYEIVYEPESDAPPPEEGDVFSISLMEKAGLVKKKRKKASRKTVNRKKSHGLNTDETETTNSKIQITNKFQSANTHRENYVAAFI